MKSTFALGFVLGFLGLLAGIFLFPVVNHARIESITSVALNGGRTETFLVRLPVDRIISVDDGFAGLRGGSRPASVELPEALSSDGLLIEHFKLRDVGGNVIGVAARHATRGASGTLAAWMISLPGRGTLTFAAPAGPPTLVDSALSRAGHVAGSAWKGEVTIDAIAPEAQAQLVGGTEEFADLVGTFDEVWTVTGVTPSGEFRGTIELRTIVSQRP